MKKIILLSALIASLPAFAQVSYRSSNSLVSSSDAIQIAPGVTIIPPAWARSIRENQVNNQNNANNNAANQNNTQTTGSEAIPNTMTVSKEESLGLANKNVNAIAQKQILETPKTPEPTKTTKPAVAAKPAPKPAMVVTSISSFNHTTQNEIEAKAAKDLEKKYSEFLMQK